MASNDRKLKVLFLLKMFWEQTDPDHGLSMKEIIEKLEEQGISAERKSIYRDIEVLRDFGLDIVSYQRAPVEYGLATRDFELNELTLLIDAVQSSRFLTERKSASLANNVKKLASVHQRKQLDRRLHVEGRIKMQNESVFAGADLVQQAILLKRKISFLYYDYDTKLEKRVRRDGEVYVRTPVEMIYSDDYYYVVTYSDKHDDLASFRLDRMQRVRVLEEPATRSPMISSFDPEAFEAQAFGMFRESPQSLVLRVKKGAMNAIVDRFGKDVKSVAHGEGEANIYVTVMVSSAFFGWLAQFGNEVVIAKPASARDAYRDYLKGLLADYE